MNLKTSNIISFIAIAISLIAMLIAYMGPSPTTEIGSTLMSAPDSANCLMPNGKMDEQCLVRVRLRQDPASAELLRSALTAEYDERCMTAAEREIVALSFLSVNDPCAGIVLMPAQPNVTHDSGYAEVYSVGDSASISAMSVSEEYPVVPMLAPSGGSPGSCVGVPGRHVCDHPDIDCRPASCSKPWVRGSWPGGSITFPGSTPITE